MGVHVRQTAAYLLSSTAAPVPTPVTTRAATRTMATSLVFMATAFSQTSVQYLLQPIQVRPGVDGCVSGAASVPRVGPALTGTYASPRQKSRVLAR